MRSQIIPLIIAIVLFTSILPGISHGQTEASDFNFQGYNDYEAVKAELEKLEENNPDIANLMVLGQTWEGRDILAMRLTDNPDIEETGEEDVLIMGGHHARELPSVEVPMYILKFLIGNYSSNSTVKQLVDSRDIWFVPLLNPDGREYVQSTGNDWRKNRRPIDTDDDGTIDGTGVDLNRNYGHLWGELPGTSHNIADSIYCGPSAFSENETQAIKDLATSQDFVISLSYHTYGEVIYYPRNNNIDTTSPKGDLLEAIAQDLGGLTGYDYMEGVDAYPSTGDSDDWLYEDTDCLPFTIELGTQWAVPDDELLTLCQKNLQAALYALDIAEEPEKTQLPDWTFMVYMSSDTGDSLVDEALVDLNEMEVAGSSSDVNIVVLYDGEDIGDSMILHIQKDAGGFNTDIISSVIDDLGVITDPPNRELDMSDPLLLGDFTSWAIENYPAQKYMLDIWGHGNGVLGGFMEDQGSLMELNQISQALEGLKLDIVGFDACSMGHLEMAAELVGISDILIGSEALEPLEGWDYEATLKSLVNEPSMSPVELSCNIVNDYLDSITETYATLSATDINVFNDSFIPLLNEFIGVSMDFAYEDYSSIWNSRNLTDTFVPAKDAVDFYEYLEKLNNHNVSEPVALRIQKLLDIKDDMIIYSGTGTAHPDSDSVAIYFPIMGNSVPQEYLDMDFAETLWDEYLTFINNPVQLPKISNLDYFSKVNNSGPYSITASVLPSGDYDLDLIYRVNSGSWSTRPMTYADDKFNASIPGQTNGSFIEYYFSLPDHNITEPYEVKWGTDNYYNFTVDAASDPEILGILVEPENNQDGNITKFTVNCINNGPDYTIANISLILEGNSTEILLGWEIATLQPGESILFSWNWTSIQGTWNATAKVESMLFQDSNLNNNAASIQVNILDEIVPPGNDGDLLYVFLILALATSIPLIVLLVALKKGKDKKLRFARKKIVSARSFVEMAEEFGGDTTQPKIMLVNAEMALKRGNARESEEWSRKARDEAMLAVADKEEK